MEKPVLLLWLDEPTWYDLITSLSEYFIQFLLLEVNLFQEMDHHRKLSESSDDGNASEESMDLPLTLNCDEEKPEEIIQRNRESFDEFKRSIEELKSEYDRNHLTLISKIKELKDISDEIESVHKNTRVGSLVGSSVGAVGGVIALVGLALSPFTLGASLALTAVGAVAGVAGGAAGGVTGAASNLTDMFKQKNLKQTIEKIISDFLEIIKPMTEHLSTISDTAVDIQRMNEILSKVKFQTPARGFDDLFKIASVADVALIGIDCAEAAKDIRVYVKAVNAIRGSAQAARAMRATAENA